MLNPTQERTLELLRRRGDPVIFERSFIIELTEQMHTALEEFTERLAGASTNADEPVGDGRGDQTILYISKHRLSSILACEVQAQLDDEFAWSPAIAGGQIAHRAIELGLNWRGEPEPGELVDEAIARVAGEDASLGTWVAGLSEADRADLRGESVERVTKFMECFPPLGARSRPLTEARLHWPRSGPIVLAGKVDLVIGRSEGNESRKVIIDLKTGRPRQQHREDLRFYALVETLRAGVPPRKLASYYLDAADAEVEDVTVALLRSTARRTLDAIDALVALHLDERPAIKRVGPQCIWCRLNAECDEGQTYLRERAASD